MFDPKEFCAKSLVVVGVAASIPAVGSAFVTLLYCWTLWPPSAINSSRYAACLAWLAFVAFGVFLVVKWGRFAWELNHVSSGNTWLWVISSGYCIVVLMGFLVPAYYIHNARRFELRVWPFGEVNPESAVIFFLLSGVAFYALVLCSALLILSLKDSASH
jgi:hypothetical protein